MEDGEFALVGPSGSGKSTIIKMITGEICCTEGKVIVNGYDMSRISRRKMPKLEAVLRRNISDFRLIEDRNVYENVALAMRVAGAKGSEIKERVPYVLSLVGLEDMMYFMPKQLSGGEQQRVAIARALANNPKVIIADEPTGNIDPELSADIMRLLTKINELGATVLIVTHEKDLVNQFAKRVIRIVDGSLVSDETGWYIS